MGLISHYPFVFFTCVFCVLFVMYFTFAPYPHGLLVVDHVNDTLHVSLASCDHVLRPEPTVCAEDAISLVLLAISRFSAYFIYPLIVSLYLTKLNHLRTLLQRSWLSLYVPFHDLHALHTIAGSYVGFDALLHSFCHLLRWGLQGRISLSWTTYTGISGVLCCVLTPLICWPMQYESIRKRLSWEVRKALHYLSVVWGLALCFHAPKQMIAMIVGVPLGLYLLDYAIGSLLRTYLVESPILTKMENGVELTFEHPKGFEADRGYIFVCLPWVAKHEWHAFSLFKHPTLPNHSSICMSANGDWTRAVHKAVRNRTVRPAWIAGPFASPYSTAVSYENLVLVASGIGITPAMDIINAYRSGNRRLSLIWTCRDASLLEYYLARGKFDKDGWTLIYYTGKRRLNVERDTLPETCLIFHGRPAWDVVVREVIGSIELGTGLPEEVVAEHEACLEDVLQARELLDRHGGLLTPYERFVRLMQAVLARKSPKDLTVAASADDDNGAAGAARAFDLARFTRLVGENMPDEFSADELDGLYAHLCEACHATAAEMSVAAFASYAETIARRQLVGQPSAVRSSVGQQRASMRLEGRRFSVCVEEEEEEQEEQDAVRIVIDQNKPPLPLPLPPPPQPTPAPIDHAISRTISSTRTATRPVAHEEIELTYSNARHEELVRTRTLLTKTRQLQVFGAQPAPKGAPHVENGRAPSLPEDEALLLDGMKKWQILYCGGAQPVVDVLSKIASDLQVDFRMEKFDW